jgi:hypothetical protein
MPILVTNTGVCRFGPSRAMPIPDDVLHDPRGSIQLVKSLEANTRPNDGPWSQSFGKKNDIAPHPEVGCPSRPGEAKRGTKLEDGRYTGLSGAGTLRAAVAPWERRERQSHIRPIKSRANRLHPLHRLGAVIWSLAFKYLMPSQSPALTSVGAQSLTTGVK